MRSGVHGLNIIIGNKPASLVERCCQTNRAAFLGLNSSPEVIRLVVIMYIGFPLSLRSVEDLLFERDIDICHERGRHSWNRFGRLFAATSAGSELAGCEAPGSGVRIARYL